jgi:RNA polymerase sigma-70 factor (ECF subfamily)
LSTFRGESKLSTWLVRIIANEALMRRRRQVKTALVIPIDGTAEAAERDGISFAPGPERDAVQGEMRARLEERIELLPAEYRAVFRLRA